MVLVLALLYYVLPLLLRAGVGPIRTKGTSARLCIPGDLQRRLARISKGNENETSHQAARLSIRDYLSNSSLVFSSLKTVNTACNRGVSNPDATASVYVQSLQSLDYHWAACQAHKCCQHKRGNFVLRNHDFLKQFCKQQQTNLIGHLKIIYAVANAMTSIVAKSYWTSLLYSKQFYTHAIPSDSKFCYFSSNRERRSFCQEPRVVDSI